MADMDTEIAKIDHTSPNFSSTYLRALNFVHYEVDDTQLRRELLQVGINFGFINVGEEISNNLHITVEHGIAYCLNRGAKLPNKSVQRIRMLFENLKNEKNEVITTVTEEPLFESINVGTKGKNILTFVDCYSLIDNAKARVLSGKLPIGELVAEVRTIVGNHSKGKGSITKQLYKHYSERLVDAKANTATKSWVKPLTVITDTLSLMAGNRASVKNSTKSAKTRKMNSTVTERDKAGEKAASKVKHKDEDTALGLKGINPANLVGAEIAVVFNTKNRHCEVYRAKAGSKLSIKGAYITNFDEKTSVGKTIRKPEQSLPQWTKAGTAKRVELLAAGIKGKSWVLTGKLNKNTLIIKVL